MTELNDAAILDQVRDYWQKIASLLVWKYAPRGLTLTQEDMKGFPPGCVLFVHGHGDSIELRVVTESEAARLLEHNARTQRGRA